MNRVCAVRFGDARKTSSGSAVRSLHSSVCPGIPGDRRWRLRREPKDDDTSQSPSSSSTARRQAVQGAWEPNATYVIPAVPTVTEDDQQPACSAAPAQQQQQAAQPNAGQPVQPASGTKRSMEASAIVSEESSHATSRLVSDLAAAGRRDECSASAR